MSIEDRLKRKFYMEMTRIEHWNTRTLDQKIDSLLYERTALSRKPEELIKKELNQITALIINRYNINLISVFFFTKKRINTLIFSAKEIIYYLCFISNLKFYRNGCY